jgi:hypothetical protein
MRFRRLLLLLACGLAGCQDSLSPGLVSLVGEWVSSSEVNRFDGSTYHVSLSLSGDQTYVRDWRYYDASTSLRAYSTTEGTFTVRGDSIFMRPVTDRNWDRDFNGGAVMVTPVSGAGIYGQAGARFEISGEILVLHFLIYPADAPVETSEALARVR